ncbi:MAG: PASTA domain-containing protein [Planctomycetota bacterium]|jgi:hypothetical protein
MKKITIVLAVLMLAAPAMAIVTITVTEVGTTNQVDITAETSGEGTLPRAFALDIVVGSNRTITGISNYFVGECTKNSRGYGIFPASFNRFIDADDPCWSEPNYTPVADVNDLPGDTQNGIGTDGITIEMGSLYKGANSPPNPVTLCTISVSGSCGISLALNVGRGKIILEDGNEPSSVVLNGVPVCCCIVPDVVGQDEATAAAAIVAEGFGVLVNYVYDDVVPPGHVVSQNPTPGSTPGCGTTVTIDVALCCCVVPNVMGMCGEVWIPIVAAGFVCNITYEFHDTVPAGCVISQNPAPGSMPGCGVVIDIVVSLGPCIVPDVVGMTEADATTAIDSNGFTAIVNYVAGLPLDEVVAQGPGVGSVPGCGTAVTIDVTAECMAASHPAYARWVAKGKPDCWCYKKNCYGDVDGLAFGPFWVSQDDKDIFVTALNQIVLPAGGICADLDRSDFGPFAVAQPDKDIFTTYLNQIVVPDCDDTHINYWK